MLNFSQASHAISTLLRAEERMRQRQLGFERTQRPQEVAAQGGNFAYVRLKSKALMATGAEYASAVKDPPRSSDILSAMVRVRVSDFDEARARDEDLSSGDHDSRE
ncbi:unnamed protein product [Cylicocyclus nassatus]|uniref:Uncharacterized protein n=1 Tax=Cylicocyclus nassatus TaxID=53992 RepID=A0AA36GG46_CYLNA|nr:unnamed protein product [Cylicocyclus nassatus]